MANKKDENIEEIENINNKSQNLDKEEKETTGV